MKTLQDKSGKSTVYLTTGVYAHIEIVVALLVVKMISCLIIASYGAGVMTSALGKNFSYVSSTFL